MAYTKKDNYPSLRKPGIYPSGSIKELGLNTDNLEKFSLGSWEDFSLSNRMFVAAGIDGNEIHLVEDGLENFPTESLFGFAHVESDVEDENIIIGDVDNKTKLINYDKKIDLENYISSSFPVKINFGIDFVPDTPVANYDQRGAGQIDVSGLSDEDILSTSDIHDISESMGTGGDYWPSVPPVNAVWGELSDGWAIGYLNWKNPGDVVAEPIDPIVLTHEITPFIIKWHRFATPRAETSGTNRIVLPNGAYEIIFNNPISKDEFPIKILDRVKLFSYWDHEYNVIDIRGDLNTISAIQLDILYAGDTTAGSTARKDMTLGFLAGEDWTYRWVDNKVGHMPAPFELRAGDDQAGSWYTLTQDGIAEAYAWAQTDFGNLGINRKSAQNGGVPILRSEDMPSHYEIVISRPKSSAAESNLDFNRLYFQDDDIRTYSGDEFISLFKESIPRSPRQLSVDIPAQSTNKGTSTPAGGGQEYIGFKGTAGQGKTNIWNNSTIYGVAVSGQAKATNVTMRARHGAYNSGTPPNADTNNMAWHGNLDDNVNDRFPITTNRFPSYIDDEMLRYPSLHLSKDSEYVIYPAPIITGDEDTVNLSFVEDKLYRLKFNVRYARQSESDDNNYNVKIGIGILDKSKDEDTSGTEYYIKALTSTHKETDLGTITEGVMHEQTLYSEIFTNSLPVNTLRGKPYITINVKFENSRTSFPTFLTHRIFFQVTDYQIEEITVDETTDDGGAFVESLNLSNSYLYKYKVLQWGDEKQKLTNEQLLNSFYLNWYNEDTSLESLNDGASLWTLKQYGNEFKSADNFIKDFNEIDNEGYFNLTSHVYNKPGLNSIKSIVYRINQEKTRVHETKLLTTNIVINDGLLLSQDFSIFGGTDFNFLPLKENQAIIGGLDEDSKYNNSVEKIKKDDNFIQDDYLERASSRDFIDNFNKKLYGESPGQLDLSTTRVYKKPLDIYDFITNDKQSIVDNNFNINTLPINSSATEIFISNNDCIVNLNPQDVEYLSIQNKTGITDKVILIGDYKVNQPKDGKIQRAGVMETPLLEDNQDKQAF